MTIVEQSWNSITPAQRVELLSLLRNARSLVLRDAESFHEASSALEHAGQVLAKRVGTGLKSYEKEIVWLAAQAKSPLLDHGGVTRLFNVVREARNTAVQEGAYARHLNSRLVDLFLLMEEAIMNTMNCVKDIMVRDPVAAQPWHQLAQVRRAMLANSFSHLPIRIGINDEDQWQIISDEAIVRYLGATVGKERRKRLANTVEGCRNELSLRAPKTCAPDDLISNIIDHLNNLPILVVEEKTHPERLLGIITPFDLL